MYTQVVRKEKRANTKNRTDLGDAMRRWRLAEKLTMQQAADMIDVEKSTWSDLENGRRTPSAETLIALEPHLGITTSELGRMGGLKVIPSEKLDDRGRRWSLIVKRFPVLVQLEDLLPEMTDDQVDSMISIAEDMVRRRKERG